MPKTITLDDIKYNLIPVATTTTTVEQPKIKPVQDPNVLHLTVTPNNSEWYHWINSDGIVNSSVWHSSNHDLDKFKYHNCYTKENADIALLIIKAKIELQNIATELNDGRVIDWRDGNQSKYNIYYNHLLQVLYSDLFCLTQISSILCLEGTFFEVALERMGEDKLKLALGMWKIS